MFELPADRPAVMGILNVTPDSFSDGGKHPTLEAALDAARAMVAEGADLIDVGGESTRPGAKPVSAEEELRRTITVVEALCSDGIPVSIDTRKAVVAREAVAAGACVVNDVSACGDHDMVAIVQRSGVNVCLMHMQGTPPTMQIAPHYADVVVSVRTFLIERAEDIMREGVRRDQIWIDPGIGFGKTDRHNFALIASLERFVDTGYPVVLGVSRKGFLGRIGGQNLPPEERLMASLALQTVAQAKGVRILRTHDVADSRRAIEAVCSLSP